MRGRLEIVGLGPGAAEHRTPAAAAAVQSADTVIGYGPYVEQCADLLRPTHAVLRAQIGEEAERAHEALARAAAGQRVALVCSGDPGIYGMAGRSLAHAAQLPADERPEVHVVPGMTAALCAASLVGAPLADDFAVISLSDLHLPWAAIERRLAALAASGVALCLYNPRSRTRTWQLPRALEVLGEHREPDVVVAIVTDAARTQQRVELTTLDTLAPDHVTMHSLLIVAGDSGQVAGDWLIASRAAVEALR